MDWHQTPGNHGNHVFDTIPLVPLQSLPRAHSPQLRCHQPLVDYIRQFSSTKDKPLCFLCSDLWMFHSCMLGMYLSIVSIGVCVCVYVCILCSFTSEDMNPVLQILNHRGGPVAWLRRNTICTCLCEKSCKHAGRG
jgi:hypothetical protein